MVHAGDVNAVQDLLQSDEKLFQVPKKYIAPVDETPVVNEPGKSVPIIDLSNLHLSPDEHQNVVREMAEASREWGFFQVINHGIDTSLLEKAQSASRTFFQLPRDEKMKWAAKKHGFKEDGYGSQIFSDENAVQLWRDFILLCNFPVRNVENWPSYPPEYRTIMAKLSDEFLVLAKRLLGFLSEGVGLPSTYFENGFGDPNMSILTNYYPSCPEPEKVLGFMPHSDFGGLTLLLQDSVPGLQVLTENAWVTVEPVPGAITVNISDLLELMSNGRYKSVIHRVRVSRDHPRMSIASNYSCAFEASVSPAPELIDEEHPRLYNSVVFGDYVANVAKRGPTGKSYMLVNKGEKPEYMILQQNKADNVDRSS